MDAEEATEDSYAEMRCYFVRERNALGGRCGGCEFSGWCGGCRVKSLRPSVSPQA